MKFLKSAIIFSVLAIFVFACTSDETVNNKPEPNTNTPTNATPEATAQTDELAAGRNLFKTNCAKCHKEDGTGGESEFEGKKHQAEDLTSDKMKKESDEEYIKYITNGIIDEGMPSFKDRLKEEEMKEIVKFIRGELQK